MRFSKSDIDAVERASDIRDIIPNLKGAGASRYTTCPNCGKSGKNKGLIVTHKEDRGKVINIAKCFSCQYTIGSSIKARQEFFNMSFVDAVKSLAEENHVQISEPKKYTVKQSESARSIKGSFCERQLFDSGLTIDDVMVRVPVPGSDEFRLEPAFRPGGADNIVYNLNDNDDEMQIHYYDLEGNHMMFKPPRDNARPKPYVRMRWSNPFAHSPIENKEVKYQTPKGAPCAFYITEYIRTRYRNAEPIKTLIIQEGEKKAEKACKHDIPSIAIQGIYNIGNAESGLLKELQYIVQRCKVQNVVLLMDSDWDHLSRNLAPDENIDARPNQFSKAVIKFLNYVKTLHKMQLSVDVYFGHINENKSGAKGIDDLLVRELNLHESDLKDDIEAAMLSHDGHGHYVDIHKITTKTEHQIRDFWGLNSSKEFFEKYRARIEELKSFRFSHINYVVEDGMIKEASRNAANERFWAVTINEKEKKTVSFKYKTALDFLEANNFYKIHTPDLKIGEHKFVKIDDCVVSETSDTFIRDYVYNYVTKSTKDEDVLDMFIKSLETYLSPGKLERLTEIKDDFSEPEPEAQTYFFKNAQVEINASEINGNPITKNVWEEKQIKREFKRIPIIEFIDRYEDGQFGINFTEEGLKSDFLQYLLCTSNFWKGKEETMTEADQNLLRQHIINKITSLGYLLNQWKPRTEQIAIVAMDARMDEIGASNGRSGKSLIGLAMSKILNVQTIDCKKLNNADDFIYSLVTPKTRLVFLDDTRVNFDFENFYSALTGDLQINPKTGARFEIKYEKAPKFYITTNHALNDQSDSGIDRRVMMAFSNFFDKKYGPADHFGHQLFDDWDEYQWCLFDNLMMECVMYYLRSFQNNWSIRKGRGVIPPPMEALRMRELRQQMGEAFLQWADAYFDQQNFAINSKISRKDLFDKYHEEFQSARETIRPGDFRKRMIAFCKFKGYHFNPMSRNEDNELFSQWIATHKGETFIGQSYKSNSKEYWMIATDEYARSQPW